MKKKTKIILIIVAVVIIAIAITIGGVINSINKNLDGLGDMEIENIDLSTISDGEYEGSFSAVPVTATVRVTVENHVITSIEVIEHQHGPGYGADAIVDNVIDSQTLQVDSISGATYSSKVILKAIENALKEAN